MFNDAVLMMFAVWRRAHPGAAVTGRGQCDGIHVERKSKYSMYPEINMTAGQISIDILYALGGD